VFNNNYEERYTFEPIEDVERYIEEVFKKSLKVIS